MLKIWRRQKSRKNTKVSIKSPKKSKPHKIKLRFLTAAAVTTLASTAVIQNPTTAAACPDLRVIFARGSGGERYTSDHYIKFKEAMDAKLKTTSLTYEIDDLDYSAVSIDVGDGHLDTLIGAYLGGGEAYEFGDSVHEGVAELLRIVNGGSCKDTKYVLAGYSQGAVVILDAIESINPDKIIYLATFGDPKIYLPEGAGLFPAACRGANLSEYRAYVPDCYAHKGILGARDPYAIAGYEGKIGTWCYKGDVLCSSHFSIKDHVSYLTSGLYEDAARFAFAKITAVFDIKDAVASAHDTAILIDSTGSMSSLIGQYKNEALRLAEKTLSSGGRVALYDYRDLSDDYTPVERCNFETCDLETFKTKLNEITVSGGGDTPESLLSASVHVMKSLNWKFGATKSLVILTDAGYHSPDRDGTTFYDVKKLSQEIDPVNFYVITNSAYADFYEDLAKATDGAVATNLDDLGLLTDQIMERYDTLPRVEEELEASAEPLPTLKITNVEEISCNSVKITFKTTGVRTLVALNNAILGVTEGNEITFTDLNCDIRNDILLVPLTETARGDAASVTFGPNPTAEDVNFDAASATDAAEAPTLIPKAPDTGRQ